MKHKENSLSPGMPRKLTRNQRIGLFLLGISCLSMLALASHPAPDIRGGGPLASAAPSPAVLGTLLATAEPDSAEKEKPQKAADVLPLARLLPDVKVLVGSPPTVIDLEGVFDKSEVAEEGRALLIEVLHNTKPKVGEATIDGNLLTINWGKKLDKSEITLSITNAETGAQLRNKLMIQVWEPDYYKLVLTVIGGLGLFLLGMKNMSEGLQAVAGSGLRRMIGAVTENRLMATGVGVLVTMAIQSSSITTVMVVGFVNSGFMTLSQACGVIMGANIGTTVTGWILVLKIGKYGLPIMGACAFAYLFVKKDGVRYLAMSCMGLGMVFFGLELMKDGFAVVKNLPAFELWFQAFTADTYWGVLKCASVGCVLTFIVQSSSATLGITISLAVTGVIPFETAAALVLGENIGTTITAWLASLGATTNARRAAYFHVTFNMLGVAWVTAIFIPIYAPFIRWLVGEVPGVEPGTTQLSDIVEAIALTHTIFNVTNTLLFIPLVRKLAALLERLVPHREAQEKSHLTSLDVRMLETSVIAIEQSRVEVLRMALGCDKLAAWIKEIMSQEVPNDKLVKKAFHREEVLDTVQDEVIEFMTSLLSGNVPHDVTEEARLQLRMADEYESISDYLILILKSHLKLQQGGLRLPEADAEGLLELHDSVADYLTLIGQGYERREMEIITKARSEGEAITHRVKELRSGFLTKMSEQKLDPNVVVAYNAQLNSYRRVREHALNVAEAMAGEK